MGIAALFRLGWKAEVIQGSFDFHRLDGQPAGVKCSLIQGPPISVIEAERGNEELQV